MAFGFEEVYVLYSGNQERVRVGSQVEWSVRNGLEWQDEPFSHWTGCFAIRSVWTIEEALSTALEGTKSFV